MAFICTLNHSKDCDACMYCKNDKQPECPVCGEEAYEFCVDREGGIIGCDRCVHMTDAWVEANKRD